MLSNDLHQVNGVHNHQGNVLDLVSDPNHVELVKSEMPLSRIDEYNYPVEDYFDRSHLQWIKRFFKLNHCNHVPTQDSYVDRYRLV